MPRCARSMIACGAFLHLASAAADGETLREIAQRKGVVFGAMILDQTWQAPQQQALVAAEFGAATVGTFWNRTRPAPGVFDWSVTDDAVQWAGAQGMAIHLHPLLYPADVQNPQWVRDELDNNPAGALALLEDHMRNAMTRYKDVVDVWDVVNEAVDPSGGYRPSKWKTALESDPNVDNYVVEAFRIARRIDPDATLLYNEHDIELSSGYQTNKWNWTKQIIQALDAEGLVDGLGWQLHTTPDEVLGAQFVAAERMQWVLDLGLKNYVTELDLEIGLGADQLDRQRQAYEEVVRVWLDKSGGGWLQTWGVYDGQSWLGSDKRPLLFDDNYAPKPARQGVADALYSVPDLGDLNGDASIDATDLGLLAAAAAAGSTDRRYDLNRDGVVDSAVGAAGVTSDSDYLVRVLLDTEYGDVNLDGVIDATDFSTLLGGFGQASGWAGGNLNGDAAVDAADFSLLLGNFGFARGGAAPSSASAQATPSVPAPPAVVAAATALLALGPCSTRPRANPHTLTAAP